MRAQTIPQIAAVTLVSAAIALLWGTGIAWLIPYFKPRETYKQERIIVARDGSPFIESRLSFDYDRPLYRTLDGREIYIRSIRPLTPARFSGTSQPPRLWNEPVPWQQRILGYYSSATPVSRWYFVIADPADRLAYFAVYDVVSKRRVGYMGRGGFSEVVPPKSEWFELRANLLRTVPIDLAGATEWVPYYPYSARNDMNEGRQKLEGLALIVDGDAVREINTRDRTIRMVYETASLQAISALTTPDQRAGEATDGLDATVEVPVSPRLAIRSEKQIAIYDPVDGTFEEFKLPNSATDADFEVYSIGNGELLLQINPQLPLGTYTVTLVWINLVGEELKRETVELSRYRPSDGSGELWLAGIAVPMPIVWGFGTTVVAPLQQMQYHRVPTYFRALDESIGWTWRPTVLSAIAAGVCCIVAVNWHRKYYRPDMWAWALTVFLLGPASLLAYWLHWRRPPRERCAACGALVPRDREACAACRVEFPPPALVGTELFA